MKVAIIYGYAEGPRIAEVFIAALRDRGHIVVQTAEADVIIAHSGGSFMIPDSSAKLILCVDVPYYDSHWSFVKKLSRRVTLEGYGRTAMKKLGWNAYYLFTEPSRGRDMKRAVIRGKFTGTSKAKVILVRNSDDNFGISAEDKGAAEQNGWQVVALPGTHDDLWANPGRYIKLMEEHV